MESTDRLAFSTFDEGEPMLLLVVAAFFMALILLVPAVIQGAMSWYRVVHPKCDNQMQSSRYSRREGDSTTDTSLAEKEAITTAFALVRTQFMVGGAIDR